MLGVQVVGVLAGEDSKTGGQVAVRLQSDGDRAWLSATVGGRMFLTEGR